MICVMFSSHNGGDDLKRMLGGLMCLQSPLGGWRLIAVDNASSDGTGNVLRSYAGRLPITVLSEPVKGKNRGLNQALDRADGDFYVFTDDDVVVPADWLVQWRATADAHPDFDLFAGNTRALWPYEPPRRLLNGINVNVCYAGHEGMAEGPCDAASMYGTNMATRASAFRDNVRFDVTIGPDGSTNYAMGSDTELAVRLGSQGLKCWFATAPTVEHIVPPAHLEPLWILGRGYRWGRGLARMKVPYSNSPKNLARKNSLKSVLYPIVLPFVSREVRWRRQWQSAVDRGYEDEIREGCGQKRRWA